MADVINLRRARKAKAREDAAQTSSQNRARYGASKAARDKQAADTARARRLLDQAKRTDSDLIPGSE
jgi:hypothetical protein